MIHYHYNYVDNDTLYIIILIQGSAQDYLEVVKMGSDKHTYNIFQSNNNI